MSARRDPSRLSPFDRAVLDGQKLGAIVGVACLAIYVVLWLGDAFGWWP